MDKSELRMAALAHACDLETTNDYGELTNYTPEEIVNNARTFFNFLTEDDKKNTFEVVQTNRKS